MFLKALVMLKIGSFSSQSTPNQHSANLVEVVQRILDREENWIRWKNAGCNPFEKNTKIVVVKRKVAETTGKVDERPSKKPATKSYTFDCSDNHIKSVASKWTSSQADFDDKVQEYIDADDPENGIEEEYHPKTNQYAHLSFLCRLPNLSYLSYFPVLVFFSCGVVCFVGAHDVSWPSATFLFSITCMTVTWARDYASSSTCRNQSL